MSLRAEQIPLADGISSEASSDLGRSSSSNSSARLRLERRLQQANQDVAGADLANEPALVDATPEEDIKRRDLYDGAPLLATWDPKRWLAPWAAGRVAICGDGYWGLNFECDDGNTVDGDGSAQDALLLNHTLPF